jgi:hypothetical protein
MVIWESALSPPYGHFWFISFPLRPADPAVVDFYFEDSRNKSTGTLLPIYPCLKGVRGVCRP